MDNINCDYWRGARHDATWSVWDSTGFSRNSCDQHLAKAVKRVSKGRHEVTVGPLFTR